MSRARRCLVIHPGALGDLLLALPALAHLARLRPGIQRVLAAARGPAILLDGSAHVEAAVDFEGLGLQGLFTEPADPARLRALAAYDVVVSWFGARDPIYRAHLGRLGRPVVIAPAIPPADSRRHASRHFLETLAPLGPVPAALLPAGLEARSADRVWARAWLAARGLGPGEAVVLHPGAGSAAKVWPGHAALARRLQTAGVPCLVVAGPADAASAARVVAEAGLGEEAVVADLGLPRLAALLETARAFVGNDSGPTHLAAAVGCPTLALFGPTDPAVWAPLGTRVSVLAGAGPGVPDPWAGLDPARAAAALRELGRAAPAGVA